MTEIVSHETLKQLRCRCGNLARKNQRNCDACNVAANRKYRMRKKANGPGIEKILRKRLAEISEEYQRWHENAEYLREREN